ncbi:MAG TPA: hypothetical protein VEH84_09485 [Alphaproteobacteria bacterium]|nr:hypothetical protein [Alphaproteobacteria bacterium]
MCMMLRRIAATLAIWLAAVGVMALAPSPSGSEALASGTTVYALTQQGYTYQDPSGAYTTTLRSLRPAHQQGE